MTSLRLGILGAGEVAERHVLGLRAAGATLVSVADPLGDRARELAGRYGFERVDRDLSDMLGAADLDVLVILTPHHQHAVQAISALRAGKHVICEKPMACTLADCDAMLEAAAKADRKLYVTHSLRGEFFFRTTMARLGTGALGRPTLASFQWFTDELARLDAPGHWKGTVKESGGGVLIDGGCHVADVANAIFGRARRVQAFGGLLVASREGLGEDTAVFNVEYDSGALSSFALSFVGGRALRQKRFAAGLDMDLFCTDGHIEAGYRLREDDFRRFFREHRPGQPDRVEVDPGSGSPGDIDREILEAMSAGKTPPVTAVDARNAVAVIDAAYRSRESGSVEEVDWRER